VGTGSLEVAWAIRKLSVVSLAFEIPDDVLDELVARVLVRLESQPRWAEIDGVAAYLNVSVRRVRDLRERGLPAKQVGRRLIFDLSAVDAWLEAQ
jgi:excisionase family DNA binding protein